MSATYEEILQGMLNKVTNEVDKREGSIIYDALAPCAYFLAQQQF
ncbi:baseplate J protein, partial [Clostridioides difficile]|nr:baseplate J protein [Clostridioides difficile]